MKKFDSQVKGNDGPGSPQGGSGLFCSPGETAASSKSGALGTYYDIMSPNSICKKEKSLESFKERYKMQDVFRRVLNDRKFGKRDKSPRINSCLRYPVHGSNVVDLMHKVGALHGSYKNLQTCGSASGCPICSGKISRGRSDEINKACRIWLDLTYGTFLMISLTIPHYKYESFSDVRTKFMSARRNLKKQKTMKRRSDLLGWDQFCEKYGVRHTIYAADFTWSERNGHHVHSHDLWFVQEKLSQEKISELQNELTAMWIYQCEKKSVGVIQNEKQVQDMIKYSVDVTEAKTAAEYIAKFGEEVFEKNRETLIGSWSAVDEVTLSHIKRGKADFAGDLHLSPWDFARMIMINPDNYEKYGRLLRSYLDEMQGKRMVQWSKGSKEFFNIPEIEDEEIVEIEEAESELVKRLQADEFKIVRDAGKRAELLILVADRDPIKIEKYIEGLKNGSTKIRSEKNGIDNGIKAGAEDRTAASDNFFGLRASGRYNERSIQKKKKGVNYADC